MSDMEWPFISNSSLAPHNLGRGMTVTARTPVLTTNVYANVMRLSPRRLRSRFLAAGMAHQGGGDVPAQLLALTDDVIE
jgi:hypothetical protein